MDNSDRDEMRVVTPPGIVCFPNVWEPHSFQPGQEKQYSIILVFNKDADLKPLQRAVRKAAIAKFGEKAKAMLERKELRMPWRRGSEYEKYGEPFTEDTIFISAKSKTAPGIVDAKAQPIMDQMEFYAGCEARISVYCAGYDQLGNRGVMLLLNNIQKTGKGKRISGRVSAEAEFGALGKVGNDDDDEDDDTFDDPPPTRTPAGRGKPATRRASTIDDDDIPF